MGNADVNRKLATNLKIVIPMSFYEESAVGGESFTKSGFLVKATRNDSEGLWVSQNLVVLSS